MMATAHPAVAERVARAYVPHAAELGLLPPLEVMARVYPEHFGGGAPEVPAAHTDVVDLGIGTYFAADPAIVQAAVDGLHGGDTHYLFRPDVAAAVADKYADEQGVALDPASEIVLVGGARAAMTLALLAVVEPGDQVLIPDPDYVGLAHPAAGLGARIVRAPMHRREDGSLTADVDRMVRDIAAGCRIVLLTNPGNPTGYVWSRRELGAVAEAVARAGGVLLVNEVYDRLVLDGARHCCALAVGERAHTIVVGGTGKVYDMTGLPLGWLAGPAWLMSRLDDVAFMFHIAPPSAPALHAGLAALRPPVRDRHPARSCELLAANARATAEVFAADSSLRFPAVRGGQFAFPWVGGDDVGLAVELKRRDGVAVMPGSAWGAQGRGHLRIALANDPQVQARGLERLRAGLQRMRPAAIADA